MLQLPLTFPGDACVFGGGQGIGAIVPGMTGHMSGRTGGGTSCTAIGVPSSRVCVKGGSTGIAQSILVADLSPRCSSGFSRPSIPAIDCL